MIAIVAMFYVSKACCHYYHHLKHQLGFYLRSGLQKPRYSWLTIIKKNLQAHPLPVFFLLVNIQEAMVPGTPKRYVTLQTGLGRMGHWTRVNSVTEENRSKRVEMLMWHVFGVWLLELCPFGLIHWELGSHKCLCRLSPKYSRICLSYVTLYTKWLNGTQYSFSLKRSCEYLRSQTWK